MRFRSATDSDIPAIVATFGDRNALPLEPRVLAALPGLLRQLIASPAVVLNVFEEAGPGGLRVWSFAGGLFLRESVVDDYLAHPAPSFVGSVLGRLLDNQRPLLTLDEIRRANTREGLELAVFPMPLGRFDWNGPEVNELRKLAPQAFVRHYGGYRLRAIYYEVFTDEVASYLQSGGYRLLHDFSVRVGTGILGPQCRPRMLRLTRAELPPGAMSMASQIFDPPAPRLGLSPAEQRVALRALDGASDQSIAEELGLSPETVRSNWRGVYHRLAEVLPHIGTQERAGHAATRGLEKRRIAVDYLRQNLHELRPVERSPRAR